MRSVKKNMNGGRRTRKVRGRQSSSRKQNRRQSSSRKQNTKQSSTRKQRGRRSQKGKQNRRRRKNQTGGALGDIFLYNEKIYREILDKGSVKYENMDLEAREKLQDKLTETKQIYPPRKILDTLQIDLFKIEPLKFMGPTPIMNPQEMGHFTLKAHPELRLLACVHEDDVTLSATGVLEGPFITRFNFFGEITDLSELGITPIKGFKFFGLKTDEVREGLVFLKEIAGMKAVRNLVDERWNPYVNSGKPRTLEATSGRTTKVVDDAEA